MIAMWYKVETINVFFKHSFDIEVLVGRHTYFYVKFIVAKAIN